MQNVNKVIEIMKCTNPNYWYSNMINAYCEVIDLDENYYMCVGSGFNKLKFEYILKDDCEFRYMSDNEMWAD